MQQDLWYWAYIFWCDSEDRSGWYNSIPQDKGFEDFIVFG